MNWFDLLNMDTTATEQQSPSYVQGMDPFEQQAYAQNLAQYLGFADDYHKGVGSGAVNPEYSYTGNKVDFSTLNDPTKSNLDKALGFFKNIGTSALNAAATPKGLAALVPAILAMLDRQGAVGGGAGQGYQGPKQYARNVTQGKYGPIVRYAAEGGLMQAYANGGHVRPFPMQDGGFVMTGDAVKGIGGIENLQQILPEAQPITGPGTATSDSIPATIRGRNGITPAKVSNGEAYVPPGRDTKGLYALMRELERKA